MDEYSNFAKISIEDNVAVALSEIEKDREEIFNGMTYSIIDTIPFEHKMALTDIQVGENIIKYGHPIGHATQLIKAGEWVHSHNVKTNLEGLLTYSYNPMIQQDYNLNGFRNSFEGYRRSNGEVGIRNEIWIIPTVSCVNKTASMIADAAQKKYGALCDGIFAYPHNAGCSQLGEDLETTQKILSSIVHHPNSGGVLIVSLGCENNDLEHLMPYLGDIDSSRIKFMITQDIYGDEIEQGLDLIGEIANVIKEDQRKSEPVSKLKIGLKCGGSDALSGITANPLCGCISDRITAFDGSAILTEVPEMFGAESILMNRSNNENTFSKVVNLINVFKKYYMDHNQPIYDNPSPGNKKGGITTLEEKSLGCIQKGGKAVVTDTLEYGEKSNKPGLNLMTGPGNDNVSITNLLSSGAHLLLFTTGRGNPLGTAIPTIKLSSNSQLYNRKTQWIDFDAGVLLNNSFEDITENLWNYILDVASGKIKTKNEINGYREIMIFKSGVLL